MAADFDGSVRVKTRTCPAPVNGPREELPEALEAVRNVPGPRMSAVWEIAESTVVATREKVRLEGSGPSMMTADGAGRGGVHVTHTALAAIDGSVTVHTVDPSMVIPITELRIQRAIKGLFGPYTA